MFVINPNVPLSKNAVDEFLKKEILKLKENLENLKGENNKLNLSLKNMQKSDK